MNEITYTMQGDYLLPDLTMPEQPELSMGRYARMRKKFLKEYHKVRYYNLLTSCALNEHLNDTERRANELEQLLTEQMAASEGVTENLKATDMMSWVRKMNSMSVLVIVGTHDMIKRSHTELIAASIPGAKLRFIKGDHFIANKNPDDFNRAVDEFLEKNV